MHPSRRILVTMSAALVVALIVLTYARFSLKTNPKLEIIYVGVSEFRPELLDDRSLILVQEQMDDPIDAAKRLMAWQYTSCKTRKRPAAAAVRCTAKFTSIVPLESTSVRVEHPSGNDMHVALKRDQILLVPRSWSVSVEVDHYVSEFHDVFTLLRSLCR